MLGVNGEGGTEARTGGGGGRGREGGTLHFRAAPFSQTLFWREEDGETWQLQHPGPGQGAGGEGWQVGTPGGTFVCEAVQASRDQRLCPLGTVFHQEQQLWRVHAHSSDLEAERDGGAGLRGCWAAGRTKGPRAQARGSPSAKDRAAGGGECWGSGVRTGDSRP